MSRITRPPDSRSLWQHRSIGRGRLPAGSCPAPTARLTGSNMPLGPLRPAALISLFVADGLISFLRRNPDMDLDALLDAQVTPPPRDRLQAIGALGKEVGL